MDNFTSRADYEQALRGIGGERGETWNRMNVALIEAGMRPSSFEWPEDELKVRQIKLSDWTWYVLGETAKSMGMYWGDRGNVRGLLEYIGMGYLRLEESDEWKKAN